MNKIIGGTKEVALQPGGSFHSHERTVKSVPASEIAETPQFSTLVTANHILHYHQVLDAYGHVSMRSPFNPNTFVMSASTAPALVSSMDDLVEYEIEDASAVEKDARKGYVERYIHSEIYKRFPMVNSVIHSHAEAVLPYGITTVPLRPLYHMGAVMGPTAPVFDIQDHYRMSDSSHSMLIDNQHLGTALAKGFIKSSASSQAFTFVSRTIWSKSDAPPPPPPNHPVVLMRGHGFTTLGTSIEEAVYRAVYAVKNATVQTQALILNNAAGVRNDEGVAPIKFLKDKEINDAWEKNSATVQRPWGLWTAEVENATLYRNEVKFSPGEDDEESGAAS